MGCLKTNLFISKPRTIEKLKQRIMEEIAAIPEQMTRRVMEKLRERLEQFLRNCGGHLRDEIFKNKMADTDFITDSNCYIIR
jgi:predicted ABC-type ATPase